MKRPLTLAAAALLLAVNGWVLAGVSRNRLGEPDATLTLSERELQIRRSTGHENSGVGLLLEVNSWQPGQPVESRYQWTPWLPAKRLAEFGFDLALPASTEAAHRLARREPARRGWAVVQLGGSRRERWEARLRVAIADLDRELANGVQGSWKKEERRQLERELRQGSRLFMIDAGPDPVDLRASYPDRASFLILPAEVYLGVPIAPASIGCDPQTCKLAGRVSLLTEELQVPRHLQHFLPPVPPTPPIGTHEDPPPPRFMAVIKSGARREPWLESIRPVSPADADATEAGAR